MKITKTKLRQIIKEEIKLILESEGDVGRNKDGTWWVEDDNGYKESAPHLEDDYRYSHLKPGDTIRRWRADRDGDGPGGGAAAYGDGRLDPHGFDRRRY